MALGAASAMTAVTADNAAAGPRHYSLPRTSPEEAGIDPAGILAFLNEVDERVGGLHSFMLLRRGAVAAEGWWQPYRPHDTQMLFSLSKSFTSTAVGLAVSDGKLSVDAPVISFFPDQLPATVEPNLAAMRVRHLLTMSTGHDQDAAGRTTSAPDGDWVRAFLSLPVELEPGTKFVYNSAATYMLSAIVQNLTGARMLDYLTLRLFDPIGIAGAAWETCPRGIDTGGWGLSLKTEDIARFGLLYLHGGRWHDRQLVPADWVQTATSKQISNGEGDTSDWTQGYGCQFWRCRHGAYRGDGAFGQYCVVMPEQEAVLAITSGVPDMQAVLTAAWDHLLPAMHAGAASNVSSGALKEKLARLAVPPPQAAASPAIAARVSGRTYRLDDNDEKLLSARFAFDSGRCRLTGSGDGGEQTMQIGSDAWERSQTDFGFQGDGKRRPVAARGAWTSDDTYTARLCFTETPFVLTLEAQFDGDTLTLNRRMNVGFGPTERPAISGQAAQPRCDPTP